MSERGTIEPRLLRALDETTRFQGGQNWSISDKDKSLLKFGRRASVGGTNVTVAPLAGEAHETLLSTNAITSVISSNDADNQTVTIEYHTINGAADELTFGVQSVALNGQTAVTLPTACARVSRVYNASSTETLGSIYVYEGGATTDGVPDTASEVHMQLVAGDQQSKKAATSISNVDTYFITGITTSAVAGTPGSQVMDFDLQTKALTGVWRTQLEWSCQIGGLNTVSIDLDPVIIVPRNHDVRITCQAASGTCDVSAMFRGYLALNS